MFSTKNLLVKGTSVCFVGLGIYNFNTFTKKIYCKEMIEPKSEKYFINAITKSRNILSMKKLLHNCPAVNVSVSVDGKIVWSEGMGWADVENHVACTPLTSMRIASISKSITMSLVAKLHQEGLLDLDKSVQEYVPEWPAKYYKGNKVDITTRQLVSMLAGIRDYTMCYEDPNQKPDKKSKMREFYQNKPYNNVTEALGMFKNDDLCSLPGTKMLYSSHSWTLISAVVEGAAKKDFASLLEALLFDLGLKHTHLDRNSRIIENRARYYEKDSIGRLINAPEVNLSYKWAGGGLMSTPEDLCLFGNTMLACYQGSQGGTTKGDQLRFMLGKDNLPSSSAEPFLSRETVQLIWKQVGKSLLPSWVDCLYAMGWCSSDKKPASIILSQESANNNQRQAFYHTGGSVGSSSILLVLARDEEKVDKSCPRGTVVAITCNMAKVGFAKEAFEIANLFEDAHDAQLEK